jgi:hypothetical protein
MKHAMKALSGICIACCSFATAIHPNSVVGADPTSRYEQPTLRTGTIYAANSDQKQVLYKFQRTLTRSGNTVKAVREYLYPDGTLAARESAVYDGNNLLSYELDELQIKAHGTVKVLRHPETTPTLVFRYVTDNNAKTNVNSEALRPDTLIGDMIAPFLAARWDDLMKGREVKCRYVAAARAETVGFKFAKHAESTFRGRPGVIVKMWPTSFIIAALVDPLFFTMERDGEHRVLQYDGRTTPKIKVGNKWKDLDAVAVFDWE